MCTILYSRPADFNGDGVPDVAIGSYNSIEIVYLRDDPDAPELGRRVIRAQEDVGVPGFVPYTFGRTVYTKWPISLQVVKDLDGNGCDELLVSGQLYDIANGTAESQGMDLLFLQDTGVAGDGAAALSPLLRAAHISPSVIPDGAEQSWFFGAVLQHLGDVDGDGADDVAVVTSFNCNSIGIYILHLSGDATHPVKDVTQLGLDEETRYWLRNCRRLDGPTVKIGRQASTAIDLRVAPTGDFHPETDFSLIMQIIDDVMGSGLPKLLLTFHSYYWYGDDRRNPSRLLLQTDLVVAPLASGFSTTQLVGSLSKPDNGWVGWVFSRQHEGPGSLADGRGLVRALKFDYWDLSEFRHWKPPVLVVMELPTPIAMMPTKTYHEPSLLEFEHPVSAAVA